MPGNYVVNPRSNGEGIDAPKYLADHQIHIDNLEPAKIDDYSGSVGQMQASTDPGELSSESQATSLSGELERLRFAIAEIKGTPQWYTSPGATLVSLLPPGVVVAYVSAIEPTGWKLCNGQTLSRTTFAALFAVIGTAFGTGDGSTTFTLPDLRSRVPLGAGTGSGLTARTLAATGGEETHVLTLAEIPSHQHGQGYAHIAGTGVNNVNIKDSEIPREETVVNDASGGGGAHNTMPPFLVMHFLVKT